MTRNQQEKPKSAQLCYLGALLPILFVLAGVCLVYEYGLPFSSRYGNTQRQAGTHQAQSQWAERLELPGVPNLHKVSEDLYRGAQPTAEGMKQLEKLGIKTVVNLRSVRSDRDEIRDTTLAYEHINMTTWDPETKDVVRFLHIVADSSRTPVFVHCRHGADRTGTMCAVYRIAVQGWSKNQAIAEMTKGGFGFHSIWQNLAEYIRELDVDEVKRSAGLNK